MIARLMRDKGVMEYVEAARMLKQRYPATRFHLLRRMDTDNPTGFTQEEVNSWAREHIVEYHEETRDVRPFLTAAQVFVLPSYYREGLPRTLLVALAPGRPIIPTDMPGCREPVREGLQLGRAHVELQSLTSISYAVSCLNNKNINYPP